MAVAASKAIWLRRVGWKSANSERALLYSLNGPFRNIFRKYHLRRSFTIAPGPELSNSELIYRFGHNLKRIFCETFLQLAGVRGTNFDDGLIRS